MTYDDIVKLKIPLTMKLWFGYGGAPEDWNGSAVMCRDGSYMAVPRVKKWPWAHDGEDSDIVAYMPNILETTLTHREQYLIEKMAQAAYYAFAMEGSEPYWDANDPEQVAIHDPNSHWPEDVEPYVGARGFRDCARAAYLNLRENITAQNITPLQIARNIISEITPEIFGDSYTEEILNGDKDKEYSKVLASLTEWVLKISMSTLRVESQAKWNGDITVGNMIANLLTLPHDMNLHAAYHSVIPGKSSVCRVKNPTLSKERVVGQTIDPQNKDEPYSAVIWSHPQPLNSDDMIEKASKAYDPDLFSDDPQIAHSAASPFTVESSRQKVRDKMRKVLEAL